MYKTSLNLQNLELFEFICVFALPNASRIMLDFGTLFEDKSDTSDKKSMA